MQKFSCYKIMAVYIGTVVGAGFASGQEILQFFTLHGIMGVMGIAAASLMFAWFGTVVLVLAVKYHAGSYRDVLVPIVGEKLTAFFDILNFIILLGGASVMLAGSGAIFKEHLGFPSFVGIFLASFITLFVIMGGLSGMVFANAVIVPVKISVVLFIIITAVTLNKGLNLPSQSFFSSGEKAVGNWFLAAVLYVSYNMLIPLAALSSMGRHIEKKTAIKAGVFGGLGLGLVASFICLGELNFYPEIKFYQVPLLFIASQINHTLQVIISLIVWIAILTTLIGNVHGIASRLSPQGGKRYKIAGLGVIFLSFPLAFYDFSTLVAILYPLFGYAGLLLLLVLMLAPMKQKM